MDTSPSRLSAKDLQIGHTAAAVGEDSTETATKLDSDTSQKPQELKQETQSPESDNKNKLSTNSTTKRKQLAVTNPASKIPGIKRVSNNLALKKNNSPQVEPNQGSTQSPIPSSDSKLSFALKDGIGVKKVQGSVSRASLVSTRGGPMKTQTNRMLATPGSASERRTATNTNRGSSLAAKKPETETNLRKITSAAGDQNKMDILEKKLTSAQSDFLAKCESLKQNIAGAKLKNQYKLITLVRNGECQFMVNDDQLRKMPQKLPADSVNDFKEKLKTYMHDWFTNSRDNPKESLEESSQDGSQEDQDPNYKALFDLIDDVCKSDKDDANDDAQIVKMQKDLQDSQESLKAAEANLAEQSKKHEEELTELKNELQSKALEDLSHKEAQIKELQKKIKLSEKQNHILKSTLQTTEKEDLSEKTKLQEELKACRESLNVMQKMHNTAERQLAHERKELNLKSETIKQLEADMVAMGAQMDAKLKTENDSEELLKQITELRNVINNLEIQKSALEERNELLLAETSANVDLLKKLQDAENRIQALQEQLTASEKLNDTKPECPKDVQVELAKLRQSEAEKRREIEKLKVELTKSIFNINQLEEQIQRDQQLLEVRSDLINSLQTNDTSQRIHMDELFAQVGEKNSTINEVQLNNELRTKSEDFRNLFATVSSKQLELSNQEHMIKLLEESNERSQMLRVKQEEKIGRMEEDIAHLKQTIAIYQANVLSSNGTLRFTPIMPRNHDDYNENFYYYTSQRKRKRQIDINVKKYEA